MKRILSILLIFAINMSFVTVRAEGVESEPDNTFEELPVQEEYFYEPIEHSETIPYAMELTDEEDFGERGISAFSLSTTERDVWKRALANEFGSDFLEPYMQKKEGYSISGNSNRLTIRETDLYLEGKNGLDLSIRRKYDNQYNKRFYTYYKGSETSVTHTREVYSFKIQETGESINIGFFSTDDLYTYLYDGAYLSRLPSKTYTEKDVTSEEGSNVTYYRFENVYTYFTTEDKAEITLEYDSETASKKVREKVSYSDYYLAQKKSLNNSVSFGNGWILDLPESYINLTYLDTYRDGNYIEQDFDCVGTFNDINGNIYYFEGTGRLKSNADTDTTTYSSSFWCDDNNYLSMKSFVRPQLLYENGPEYNFIVYDSCGLTYYFYNSGIKQSGLSRSQPMVIVAVSDRYGNMIRYERDGNSLIVNKIIDTYGREVNISPSGISYYDKEKDELKTISYNSSQLPASALENDSYLSEKPVLRLTVTNEIGEQTIYDAREVEIMCHYESTSTSRDITEITDPQDQRYEFINNYNIERITYPDNSQVNFKYKPYYIQNGHIRMGTYAVEESYLKKDSQIKNRKTYSLSGDAVPQEIEETDLSRGSKTVNTYIDGLLETSTKDEEHGLGQIYISRRYDGYNHLKNEYKNNNGAVTDEYYSYKTSYPDSLEYVYDDKQRIDYTYHTIDGDLTNIPKTITYSYKNGRSWKIDYIITTTLTSDKKSIEYQTVTKAGETKAKTKYSYNESGEVTEIKYWTGDTNSDGLFDEADETITINNSYTVTGNDALRICQSIGGIIDADGNSISDIAEIYEYDIYGNPTVQTDAKNYKTEIVYDGIGRPVLYKYPNGAQQDIEYNNELNYAVVTDVSGKKFKYSYDSFGNLLSESFNEDNEWKVTGEYTYDDANRLVMSKNYTEPQMYIKKTYEYDIFDRLTKETVYDNSDNVQYIVNYTYTSWGSLVKTKAETDSQDGAEVADISEYYDAYGRKVKTEKGTGSGAIVTETEYDYQDRVISEKDANENVTQYTYDYAGNLLNVKNAANQEISYTYDALNRQLSATDANGNTTNYYYDNLGRNIKIEMPFSGSEKAVTKNYYDANSNLIQSKTQNNELTDEESFRTINYSYDNMNRLTQVYGDTDYVSYSYDIAGRITQMFAGNNENLQSTYSYDNRGFLASETDALGLSKYYTYDYAGNVKTMTDKNGAVHTNTYGIFGLTSQISQKGSLQQSLNYEYDSLGRIKTKTLNDADNTDISSYTYDVFGRILTNTSNAAVNSYTYDKNSNITAYELKENNIVKNSVTYEYNSINQLTKEIIGDTIMTYSYDNNGNITGKTIGGIATQIGYNKANLPVSMVTEGFGNEEYGYSLDGNRISEKDTVNNINKQYQYDAKGRLVGEVHSGAESFAKTYTYDAFGNRKSETQTGLGTTNYSYDRNNRLLKEEFLNSAGELNKEVNYYYDRNGNQMKKQELLFTDEGQDGISISGVSGSTVSEYSYNLNNQLTGYRSGDVEAYYSYTAEGLRKAKTVNGVTTEFIWDGGNLAAERKSGEITALYNYGADGIVMSNRDGAAEYYIKNIHGDVVGMTDAEGNLTDNYYYDAFGNEQSNTENTNPFRYCGEYYDEESGLIYLRNRYYNSSTGRFITEDPYWNIDNMMYGDEEESPVKDIVFINKEIYKINNENIVLNHLQGEKAENGQGFNAFIKAEEKAYSNENESQEKNNSIQLFAIEQSSNLYVYCINNPIRFIDPSGYNAIVTIHVVRDGNSRTCEVILSWSGNEMYSSWRFNSVSVVAYSKTYGTIRNTTVYPGAATSGSVSLGYVIIPQNIKRIKVKVNGLLGYNMQKGWQSVYMIPINANIK